MTPRRSSLVAGPGSYRLLVAGLGLCLSGCLIPKAHPVEVATYGLEPPRLETASAVKPVHWQLLVDSPLAAGSLASGRISVREADGTLAVLRGVRWQQRTPELVQSLLIQALEDSGRVKGVARPGSGVRGDYLLLTELRAFEADYSQGRVPAVRMVLGAKLVCTARQEVVAAHLFRQSEPAAAASAASIMAAFRRTARRLTGEVVDWALENGQMDHLRRAGGSPGR